MPLVGEWVIGGKENKEGNNINNNSFMGFLVYFVFTSLTQIRSSHPADDPLRFSQLGLSRLKIKEGTR